MDSQAVVPTNLSPSQRPQQKEGGQPGPVLAFRVVGSPSLASHRHCGHSDMPPPVLPWPAEPQPAPQTLAGEPWDNLG